MAVQGGAEEDVYATLLLSDTYLPGALVLAHSLRDAGTSKKLAILVTLDTALYDYVIPVSRIRNSQPENLQLMNRADLHSAFTKINLWKQTQFRKIVYIDCDVVAYRAPDELFDIPHPFSAAPDIGWPDLFNTGVMVLTPNLGDYYAMIAMAERSISFDGADQGLINMHFKNNYNRLSFTYNVTPSGHYQYVPAYRHFQSGISMVHFIGPDKPWFKGRRASVGSSPYDEMTGRWWAVYDRHYRIPTPTATPSISGGSSVTSSTATEPVPELIRYFTKGEYQPKATHVQVTGEHYRSDYQAPQQQFHHGHVEALPGTTTSQSKPFSTSPMAASSSHGNIEGIHAEAREGQVSESSHGTLPPLNEPAHEPPVFQPTMSSWDAQRQSPPTDSKPEAMNFPSIVYEMSRSTAPFIPPERYPSPPKNMWYQVPKESPASASKPKPIFPWEEHRPEPTRVFPDEHPKRKDTGSEGTGSPSGIFLGSPRPATRHQTSTVPSITKASTTEQKREPLTPTAPTDWSSFTFTNAWDEVPQIERYVEKLQKHKFKRSVKSPAVPALPEYGEEAEITWRRRGSKITDFPSAFERPSLPVTPAPIRRPNFWGGGPGVGGGDDHKQLLPVAEGVPAQTEWVCVHGKRWSPADCLCDLTNVLRYHKDPVTQLQKLAKQQSEALLQKLGSGRRDSSDLPSRPLPFGSEELISPTYVAQTAKVLSPQPVKGSTSSSAVHNIISSLESTPSTSTPSTQSTAIADAPTIPEPSYTGPGASFEKGEDLPTEDTSTPRVISAQHTDIPQPSYTGPGPVFEKGEIVPTEDAPIPHATASPSAATKDTGIPQPSYTGPGPAFEKGENIPIVEEDAS
ncbi:glycosyltransferase family 8 protein [Hypoxylon sp. FL0890]|nr:glycosyltransferase family 8 protein [Hypoxylon sp. FL0890]